LGKYLSFSVFSQLLNEPLIKIIRKSSKSREQLRLSLSGPKLLGPLSTINHSFRFNRMLYLLRLPAAD